MINVYNTLIISDSFIDQETIKELPEPYLILTEKDFNIEVPKENIIINKINSCFYRNRMYTFELIDKTVINSQNIIVIQNKIDKALACNGKEIPCVVSDFKSTLKSARGSQAFLIAQKESDLKFGIKLAQKYRYVYVGTSKEFEQKAETSEFFEKLTQLDNVVTFPSIIFPIIDFKTYKSDKLSKVILSNFGEISCNKIYCQLPKEFYTPEWLKQFVEYKTNGQIKINSNGSTNEANSLFVIGDLSGNYDIKKILNKIKGETI